VVENEEENYSYIEEDIDTPIESLKRGDMLPDDKIDFSLTVDPRIQVKAPIFNPIVKEDSALNHVTTASPPRRNQKIVYKMTVFNILSIKGCA